MVLLEDLLKRILFKNSIYYFEYFRKLLLSSYVFKQEGDVTIINQINPRSNLHKPATDLSEVFCSTRYPPKGLESLPPPSEELEDSSDEMEQRLHIYDKDDWKKEILIGLVE